jgi:formate C-acetyltransferase
MDKAGGNGGLAERFFEIGEPYAGGFYEAPDRDRFFRFARAQRRFWEQAPLDGYRGGALYPCGSKCPRPPAVRPDYSYTFTVDWRALEEKWEEAPSLLRRETDLFLWVGLPHNVGGDLYTHSIPNYDRVVREGLEAHRARIERLPAGDFREGLLELLEGIRAYHRRCVEALLPEARGENAAKVEKLLAALARVPFAPARDLYEALVCWNFVYYLDGCDNPGRLDTDLIPWHRGEDYTALFVEFFTSVDENTGWSGALGPDCNALTLQCLRAIKGLRRPSLELRVDGRTPPEIWEAAADSLSTGCGQPALYNETLYQRALGERFPAIPAGDLLRFNGGGCTETMLAGISNVGSLDAGLNLPFIFEPYMRRNLEAAGSFDSFYRGLLEEIRAALLPVLERISACQERRARVRPQPVRTLLIDDCIEKGKDFNAGGARWYWSVVNLAGLINVVDSLLAIRHLVYGPPAGRAASTAPAAPTLAPAEFLAGLAEQKPGFLRALASCPCFGVDDAEADGLAADFAGQVFDMLRERKPFLGGQFLPSSIQFVTYAAAGREVGATPDGRERGAPLADSLAAVHGKDRAGPTAMLNSVAKLPLYKAAGTPVLNLRLRKSDLAARLRPLVSGFFDQGGMQVQVSCFSREDMLDAMEHPERHENLMVRIGGYSEYFNYLPRELKETVLARTEF